MFYFTPLELKTRVLMLDENHLVVASQEIYESKRFTMYGQRHWRDWLTETITHQDKVCLANTINKEESLLRMEILNWFESKE